MATTKSKAPRVVATYGELQGSPVVRFDVKTRGETVTVIVGLDKRSVQAYFGKPGLVATGTGTLAPKGPKGTTVEVFSAAPVPARTKPPKARKLPPAKLGDGGPTPPPPIRPPS